MTACSVRGKANGSLPTGLNRPLTTSSSAVSLTPKPATIAPASFKPLASSSTYGLRK